MKNRFLFLVGLLMAVFNIGMNAGLFGQTIAPKKVGTLWYQFDDSAKAASYYATYGPQDTVYLHDTTRIPAPPPIVIHDTIRIHDTVAPLPPFTVRLSGTVPGFKTVPGTTYIGDSTLKITSTVTLMSNVTFDAGGGWYVGTGPAFRSNGGAVNVSVYNISSRTASQIFYGSGTSVYNGTPQSALWYNLRTKNITCIGATMMYNGVWDGPRTLRNLCIGFYSYGTTIINDSTVTGCGNQKVWGHSIYAFTADNWNVSGTTKQRLVDNGVVQIESGNGKVINSYRNGKMCGYWFRLLGMAKLSGIPFNQDSSGIYNTVDANTTAYGTLDGRIDTSRLIKTGAVTSSGGDIWFVNNTSANKSDLVVVNGIGGYVTSAAVIGAMPGFTFHVNKSIAFGAQYKTDGSTNNSSLIKDNRSGAGTIDSSNNIDIPPGVQIPAGIVDSTFYSLKAVGAQRPTITISNL